MLECATGLNDGRLWAENYKCMICGMGSKKENIWRTCHCFKRIGNELDNTLKIWVQQTQWPTRVAAYCRYEWRIVRVVSNMVGFDKSEVGKQAVGYLPPFLRMKTERQRC